jgi:hypothetical protein
MSGTVPPFEELFASTSYTAVHLEMRDAYVPNDPSFIAWKGGPPFDRSERESGWRSIISSAVARGIVVRRARIVSEPVTDYIRYEYDVTASTNIAGGEQVRWLPRRRASDLALPGNDYWLFDDHTIRFHFFAGDGEITGEQLCTDPAAIRLCASAFEAVWERAIPHEDYRPA